MPDGKEVWNTVFHLNVIWPFFCPKELPQYVLLFYSDDKVAQTILFLLLF